MIKNPIRPDRDGFSKDPFGYSSLASLKWAMIQEDAGLPVDVMKRPTSEELKSPVLWLAHAHAMSEAALVVLKNEPEFASMPVPIRGICDSQYCAIGLMLVGYSLEICLKAMLIIRLGVEAYTEAGRHNEHHRLADLAKFIPDLSVKDAVILKILTHFVMWAGRYPDPGARREGHADEIFSLSETHQVSGQDVFSLAGRVMGYVSQLVD
jgi:hypothetical protein